MEEFPVVEDGTEGEETFGQPFDIVAAERRLRSIGDMILDAQAFSDRLSKHYAE